MSSLDSLHSPDITPSLSSVESLRTSLPKEYRSLFDTLRKEVMDFCDRHSIPTSSLNKDEALRESTKHLSNSDLEHLSLVLARLDYLVTHKEPMPEKRVNLTQEQAREIMGENFLGIREAEEHFGELSGEQKEALSIIPFSRETLEACKETHILVADIGLSILDIQKVDICKNLFCPHNWYDDVEFAKRIEAARWRLIRKTPVKDSLNKTWDEQQVLINQETDVIPSTRQVVYTMILHVFTTGERLFKTLFVRTCDVDSSGNYVRVGRFNEDGFDIRIWHNYDQNIFIGVASARKPMILEH